MRLVYALIVVSTLSRWAGALTSPAQGYSVTGSSVVAFQGGAPWSVSQSTVNVQNTPGGSLIVGTHGVTESGTWTVTPGTGTFGVSVSSTVMPADRSSIGTISAVNGVFIATTTGASSVAFDVSGTFVASFLFEATTGDGVWRSVGAIIPDFQASVFTSASTDLFVIQCGGYTQVRLRAYAYTSGTLNITYNAAAGGNYVSQGVPLALAYAWPVKPTDGTNSQSFTATGQALVSASQSGAWSVGFTSGSFSNPLYTISTSTLVSPINWSVASATQTIVQSTTGVIGSVSFGNTVGKTNVFSSSSAVTAATGATVVLSSRTVTIGKTFYLQHVDMNSRLTTASVTAGALGSMVIFTPGGSLISSMTFTNNSADTGRYELNFAEPLPFASGTVIASSATANSATSTMFQTNFIGYEK